MSTFVFIMKGVTPYVDHQSKEQRPRNPLSHFALKGGPQLEAATGISNSDARKICAKPDPVFQSAPTLTSEHEKQEVGIHQIVIFGSWCCLKLHFLKEHFLTKNGLAALHWQTH